METVTVNVAKDFSRYPAGRYVSDGPHSGEAFRDQVLVPALLKGGNVEVLLSGAVGFGSSFLEEAFGGLVRTCGFDRDDLRRRLKLVSNDTTELREIERFIKNARPGGSIDRR